ncbi:MAG: PD-(D/E)XK nuclease family protein [Bacteroidia bacterium]|nr:PD-(D/E)XK nuclease family protein [Bacteroidia bacterium]
MKGFIDQVAAETAGLPPRDTLVIFPTQRACQVYRERLAKLFGKVSWLPTCLPVRDLLSKLEVPPVQDDLGLLLRLYAVHCRLFGQEEFSSFQSYGEQVLDDFNEIDRQLLHAAFLFEEISDLKTLEERFAPGAEEAEYLKRFWSEFIRTPHTPLQHSFLKYWKQLPQLYRTFREELQREGLAFEGMAWRLAVEDTKRLHFFDRFQQVVFAGFYALTKTEEKLLAYLQVTGKLKVYIDADPYYISPFHEAGMFFRKGALSDASLPWTRPHFEIPKESYRTIACNGRYALCLQMAQDLRKAIDSGADATEINDAVIVLADEGLLFPFMHHCSRLEIALNPSMGFPLKHHPALRLLHLMRQFRKLSATDSSGAAAYRLKEETLADPLVKRFLQGTPPTAEGFGFILPDSGTRHIGSEKKKILEVLEAFHFKEDEWMNRLQEHLILSVKNCFAVLELHEEELQIDNWWSLFLHALEMLRVPFDAKEGIPVMGFLETRVLDFKSVYIAPLNEGALPSGSVSKSLIPYSLRKAHHLPCSEEQDAITAYHFFRLLQRARQINLYYNSNLNDTGGGEKSRYLFQLHHEIIEKYPPQSCSILQQESRMTAASPAPILVMKSPAILQQMTALYVEGHTGDTLFPGLSASAINSYISCSLRFYFDQLARIRPDDKTEGLSAGHFGNVLHKAMELSYREGEVVDAGRIDTLLDLLPETMNQAVEIAYRKPAGSGHDYLMKGVLTELVKRIFLHDRDESPFSILGLEEKLKTTVPVQGLGRVFLKGIIDRIDVYQGYLRILDYKTGQEKLKDTEEVELIFRDTRYKLNLQLMLYTLLVRDSFPENDKPLKTGIFKMREFDEGVSWLQEGHAVREEQLAAFREMLIRLITELFDGAVPFRQTDDLKQCRFCDYKNLCSRQSL